MGADAISSWVKLLVSLGLEVYRAVQSGQRTKTVGEIFAGVEPDGAEMGRLEAEARAHYDRVQAEAADRAASEARVSVADIAVLQRLTQGATLTHEQRGSVQRVTRWMGARLAIPMPAVLDTERPPPNPFDEGGP